jgi:hypothetical protein
VLCADPAYVVIPQEKKTKKNSKPKPRFRSSSSFVVFVFAYLTGVQGVGYGAEMRLELATRATAAGKLLAALLGERLRRSQLAALTPS